MIHTQDGFDSFLKVYSSWTARHMDRDEVANLPSECANVDFLLEIIFKSSQFKKRVDLNDKSVFQLASVVTSGSNDKAIQRVTIFSSFLTSYASTSVQLMIM